MQDENAINQPGNDVTIDAPHRGDIRCRTLTISRNGSLFGNVLAEEVRVAGRFDGTAHSTRFYAAAGSKVFGSVYAAEIGIKPGASLHAHMGPEFPVPQQFSPALARSTEEAILRGIDQGVRSEQSRLGRQQIEPAVPAKSRQGIESVLAAIPAPISLPAAAEGSPSEIPLVPQAASAPAASLATARPAARKALPSIL